MVSQTRKLLALSLVALSLTSCNFSKKDSSVSSHAEESSVSESSVSESESSIEESESSLEESESSLESEEGESVLSQYTVTFLNYDGTQLYQTVVEEGQSAEYVGETPNKPAEEGAEYTYEFIGWDKDLEEILEDTITTALFEAKGSDSWGDIIWC